MTNQEAISSMKKNWWTFSKNLQDKHKNYLLSDVKVEKEEYDRFVVSAVVSENGIKDEQLSGNYVVFKETGGCRPAIFFDGS